MAEARTARRAVGSIGALLQSWRRTRRFSQLALAGEAGISARHLCFLGGAPPGPANVIRMMFDPRGLRPYVTNWPAVAEALVRRIHREAVGRVEDAATTLLLEETFAYPGVPRSWRAPDPAAPIEPVVPVSFRKDDRTFNFFSTVTTLGTPQDITLQEIRIECFFPVDRETARQAKELADEDRSAGPSRR